MSPRSGRADGGGGQSQRIDVVVRQTRSPPEGQEVPHRRTVPSRAPRCLASSERSPAAAHGQSSLVLLSSSPTASHVSFHRRATIFQTAFPAGVCLNSCTNFGPLAQGQPSVRRASRIRCRSFAGRTADAVLSRRQQFQRYCSCLMAHSKSRPTETPPQLRTYHHVCPYGHLCASTIYAAQSMFKVQSPLRPSSVVAVAVTQVRPTTWTDLRPYLYR